MEVAMATPATAFLVFLLGAGSAFGQLDSVESSTEEVGSSCNSTTYFSVRSAWASEDEPCHQKLSMNMWTFMKAGGSSQDADAQHVYVECLRQPEMGLVELITPEDWNSTTVGAAPGEIVGESEHAATLLCKGAEDFEAVCNDDEVAKASRVRAIAGSSFPFRRTPRRLQTTTSEAGAAHQVDELIQGLQDLGCLRTTGEDQTLCVLSDSFDNNGDASSLQASGDLPPVDVVKELTTGDGSDEGSAMIELAFDIASGATYKFNSALLGQETFADDIGVLAAAEDCDVIVDDVGYWASPSFRDGIISTAVDSATQDHDILYFTSAGNDGFGRRIVADWECQGVLFTNDFLAPCTSGVSAHVFVPSSGTEFRYLLPFVSGSTSPVHLKWDDDEGSAREMTIVIWEYSFFFFVPFVWAMESSEAGSATVSIPAPGDGQRYYISVHHIGGGSLEAVNMHLVSSGNTFDVSGTTAVSGAIYGQACATNAFSVAAIPYSSASGEGGAFGDPEPSAVEDFSSRGPCFVDAGQGLSQRNHPVTTAADDLQTSTDGFNPFSGTSAAAPVAAAIATIIRAACFPRVVTYSDMMEMLTDYHYTIDATSDANGDSETFGADAGYGIISAQQMCLWVAENCPETCPNTDAGAHGDPHLVGLAGQKFDFTGKSNSWYALLSAWGTDHVNMRVTSPLAELAVVTYITGISVQTKDSDGAVHSIFIAVGDPTVLDISCPLDGQPCIGNGALTVLLDGESVTAPGTRELGPGVSFGAVNIPGECRPFGFERYWQQKIREAEPLATQGGRRLSEAPTMDRWIAEDPSATNPTECEEYVSNAMEHDSLFAHQADHVSFQVVTPHLTLRLNHGKLHQLPERDPTDTFDIPDHTTFQMNLGFVDVKREDTMQGIIGETAVPTIDEDGAKIMSGLKAIRGQEDDYKVDGPFGKTFNQLITAV